MSNEPKDAELEVFLQNALEIQSADREDDLSEDRLREIAQRAGLDDDDWRRLGNELEGRLEKGRNFLKFGNHSDAIAELDGAVALAPYRANVLSDCARAHQLKWQETGDPSSLERAEELFRKCLRIDAAHAGAARGIAELKSFARTSRMLRRRLNPRVVALTVALIGVIGFSLVRWFWQDANPPGDSAAELLAEAVREYDGNRYLLVRIPMTQVEAFEYSRKLGGQLVAIENPAENSWLYKTFGSEMARFKMNAWIGATDAAGEGNWVWEDGSPVSIENWTGSGPNNRGSEDGALMVSNSDKWNDASATKKWWFFCEWDRWPPELAPDLNKNQLKESLVSGQ